MPTVAQELPEEGELDPTLDYDNYKFVSIDDVSKMLSQKHRQKVDNIVEHYDNLVKRTSSINLLLEDDYNAINVRTTALKKVSHCLVLFASLISKGISSRLLKWKRL